jgi:2-polyprenyl-3-methyl-5-hydroxy-6-metoxy-1,4-benzoquinol methylase
MKTCNSIAECQEEKNKIFIVNGHKILECIKCEHRFTCTQNIEAHLKNVYSDKYFFGGKDGYTNYLEREKILVRQGIRYANIISKYVDVPGTVLVVGCASGFVLKGFNESGWSCNGIDPNLTMVNYGVKELGLNLEIGNLESFKSNKKYDLITLIQVVGHFHDIDKAIKNAYKLLNPNGLILVESWNYNSIFTKVLGKYWHEYNPPSVIHWFSHKTLINFFNFYNFKLVKAGLPLKQIKLNHAVSLIGTKVPKSRFMKKLSRVVDKALGKLTIIYPPIDIKWYLFQK